MGFHFRQPTAPRELPFVFFVLFVVRLRHPVAESATTGSEGALTGLAPGAWRIAPRKTGSAGASLSAVDAAYVLQKIGGTRSFDADQTLAADVTGDGTVSALDATRILQRVVGIGGQFPPRNVAVPTGCSRRSPPPFPAR
jgi:hypothetical protein